MTNTSQHGQQDRQYWTETLDRVARPVFHALAARQLKATMPVETVHDRPRDHVSHLEAVGRALAGLAPWMEATNLEPAETRVRDRLLGLVQEGLRAACDPASPDYLNFSEDRQPLVDAAFLAHGILRAPRALWADLDASTQQYVIAALKGVRQIIPNWNNWLLFVAMVETFLHQMAGEGDLLRIEFALRQHDAWYKGDGMYGDGPFIHVDYYNSYVIHPMLLDITHVVRGHLSYAAEAYPTFVERARRYAAIQERTVAPDGSFPVVGRSITYRAGAFQTLAQMALRDELPDGVTPAQVRGALTAVMRRTLDAPGTYDEAGWLRLGLAGHQPELAETYISTGSLYLCTTAFLPLGLSPARAFWADAPAAWTGQRVWAGGSILRDGAIDGFKDK